MIPYRVWMQYSPQGEWAQHFDNGFIVLISPSDYFDRLQHSDELAGAGLELGRNALVFYETRTQWTANPPETLGWQPAKKRNNPLGGQYVARISATTASDNTGSKIVRGFNTTSNKGAGIRVYEYAGSTEIAECRLQLEALFWLCDDSEAVVVANGMTASAAAFQKNGRLEQCKRMGLLDLDRLTQTRIVNRDGRTICPLCLEELSGHGFLNRMKQAAGREVLDLTITQINLFHIEEVQMGSFNHRPYNLGWGHHHCNVVVKDAGIKATLRWMKELLRRNSEQGYLE